MPVAQLEIPATVATLLESVDPLVELADHLFTMGIMNLARVLFAAFRNGHVYQFVEEGLQVSSDKVYGDWARPA
eukprot:6186289-Pleurochrysis_carterae.AAC.2